MDKEVIEVKKEGRGEIILPGQASVENPVFELRRDIEQDRVKTTAALGDLATDLDERERALRVNIQSDYDILESHIRDVEKRFNAKQKDMISCIHKLEKLIVERGFKT